MLITLLDFLGVILVGGAVLGCQYLLASAWSLWVFFRQKPLRATLLPPVTILKPLSGDEHDLACNLRSFCQQDYPQHQIVFGVQKTDDSALPIIRAIISEFPHLDIQLVIDDTQQSENMKVANLQNMLPAAKYDYLVIADSDMRVRPDYLSDIVPPLLDDKVGVVTCLYRGMSRGNIWSDLGSMQLNYNFMPQAMLGEILKIGNGCFGATMALRRTVLESIGGLKAIGPVFADDH
jgi:ceramide glucosyltransferase